jgi:AcrR family transcriptional regulator
VTSHLRADAERNRLRLLEAAAEVLGRRGLSASVSEIARKAGVGQGTVFRRFPSKDALIAAVVVYRLEQMSRLAEDAAAKPPEDGLAVFLERAVPLYLQDRCLYEALEGHPIVDPAVLEQQAQLLDAIERLVERGRAAGAVRGDVKAVDIAMLASGVARAAAALLPASPQIWRRYLRIAFDGLRPEGASRLPVRAPTRAEFDSACKVGSELRDADAAAD